MDSECPKCHATIRMSGFGYDETTSHDEVGESVFQHNESDACPNCGESFQAEHAARDQASVVTVEVATNEAPRMFSHFQLIRMLGRGGFGTVWLANDTRLHRNVALKLPTTRAGRVSAMLKEARTAAKLQHPNVVAVHEVDEFQGQAFIVSEFVDGTDMHKYLRNGVPPIETTVAFLQAIASGLQHAHDNCIVHRDIKPANVLIRRDNTPLLTDFGLAKKADVEESVSSRGKIVGTYIYMSPEQAGHGSATVSYQSDIYSLGVMMYEMLTGERPFRGELPAILEQKVSGEPVPPRSLRTSIPIDLETICLKCLRLQPERRYQTADEFNEELERFRTGRPILARPTSKLYHAWRWCRRNPLVSTLLTLLFVSLVTGLTSTSVFWKKAINKTALLQRALYNSQLQLVGGHFQAGEIQTVRSSIDHLRAAPLNQYESFEVRYLASQLERFVNVVQHGQVVRSVAISRDGQWFASVSNDRRLLIWDAKSTTPIREIEAKVGRWLSVDISPRDNRVAVGSKDGSVYVWRSIHDTTLQPEATKHGVSVEFVEFSGDGQRLFTAGVKGAIRAWDATTLELIQELPSGQGGVVAMDVSRDGSVVAVAGREGIVRVWDVDQREMLCNIETGHRVESIAISPGADRIVLGTYTGLLLAYEVASANALFELNTDYDWISSLAFMANTPLVSLCSSNGSVVVFDIDRQREVSEHITHHFANGTIDVTPNGTSLAVGALDGTVKLLRMDDFRLPTVIDDGNSVSDIRILNDTSMLVAHHDGSVLMHRFNEPEPVTLRKPENDFVAEIAVSPVKQWIGYQSSPAVISIADMRGAQIATIAVDASGPVRLREANQLGKLVVADGNGTMNVYSIDPHQVPIVQRETAKPLELGMPAQQMCVDDAAARIAVVTAGNEVQLLDIASRTVSPLLMDLSAKITCVAFCGNHLLVGTSDGFLQQINLDNCELVWRVKAHVGHVAKVHVVSDQRAIISVGRDSLLSFSDVIDGSLRMNLIQNRTRLVAVDALSDDSCIATASGDGQLRIWNCNLRQRLKIK